MIEGKQLNTVNEFFQMLVEESKQYTKHKVYAGSVEDGTSVEVRALIMPEEIRFSKDITQLDELKSEVLNKLKELQDDSDH